MKIKNLTDAELLVLGLLSEMPRHGYELEQVIEQRGMREWTEIGFSSIYYLLEKLKKIELVAEQKPVGIKQAGIKAKKIFSLTDIGRDALVKQTLSALKTFRPSYSSVLHGMIHWSVLERQEALEALEARSTSVKTEILRLEDVQLEQQPLPDSTDALFEFLLSQLKAEAEWIMRTYDYMKTKPWND